MNASRRKMVPAMPNTDLIEQNTEYSGLVDSKNFFQPFIELYLLLRIQYAEVRETWIWVIVMASIFPLSTLLFMKFFITSPTPEMTMRIISGNMIFPIIIMGINGLGNHISNCKQQGHFTYYASLPISKINFLAALTIRGFLMSLPSVIIMAYIGQIVFQLPIHFTIGVLPMILLSIGACSGIGALIGFLSPNLELTNMITNLLMVFLNFLTPVMVDASQLPSVLQWVSYFFPTTYAAHGLQILFLHGWTLSVTWDALALGGFIVLSMFIIIWKMDWRVES
jgi:ABC-2 type transport system permease protein